jgi:hypothetical protein
MQLNFLNEELKFLRRSVLNVIRKRISQAKSIIAFVFQNLYTDTIQCNNELNGLILSVLNINIEIITIELSNAAHCRRD